MARVVRFWEGNRYDIGLLVKSGQKYAHIIPMDAAGLRVVRRPADDEVSFEYLDYSGVRLEQALIRFANVARKRSTDEARRYIEAALDEVITNKRREAA